MLGSWEWSYECKACGKPHWIMKTKDGLYCPEKGFLEPAQRPTTVAADSPISTVSKLCKNCHQIHSGAVCLPKTANR